MHIMAMEALDDSSYLWQDGACNSLLRASQLVDPETSFCKATQRYFHAVHRPVQGRLHSVLCKV